MTKLIIKGNFGTIKKKHANNSNLSSLGKTLDPLLMNFDYK